MKSWFSQTSANPDPVETASASLRTLSERGVQIPSHISTPIIAARSAGNLAQASAQVQSEFWAAYGTLNSRIKSPEDAKDYYRRFFYWILAALLLLQLYYSAFASVQKGLLEVNKEIDARQVAVATAVVPPPAGAGPGSSHALNIELLEKRQTYLNSADYLMSVPRYAAGFLKVVGLGAGDVRAPGKYEIVAQVQLELATSFVGGFLLPVLYGMLGAIAFVLRRLSDDGSIDGETPTLKKRFSLRVPIGALSGLAAGWLLQPSTGGLSGSLSPLALAFVAGYSADLVFTAMDRIVAAFSTAPAPKPDPAPEPRSPLEQDPSSVVDGTEPVPLPAPADGGSSPGTSAGTAAPSSRAQANQDA
jgi:hypothetical protein